MKNTLGGSKKSIFGAMKYIVVVSALATTFLLPKTSTAQVHNRDGKLPIVPRYVPTTRAFIEKLSKLSGEDINNLRVFTDQDILKRQNQKPEDLDYSGAYVYVDPQGKSYYRYSPDRLRVALDTAESPTIRSASEYREQKFTAVTELEFRRWSKLNNADTPLLDQTSSKEGSKCYMTTCVNNHMGDRDPANYYYWIDYDYPGTVRYGHDKITSVKEAIPVKEVSTDTDTTTTSTHSDPETSTDLDFDSPETVKAFEALIQDDRVKTFRSKSPYMIDYSRDPNGIVTDIDGKKCPKYNGILIQDQSVDKNKRVISPSESNNSVSFSTLLARIQLLGLDKRAIRYYLNNNPDAKSKFSYVSKLKKEHIDYMKKVLFEDIPNFIRSSEAYVPPVYREDWKPDIPSYDGDGGTPTDTKPSPKPLSPTNKKTVTDKSLDALIDE